jgi:UDP-N-acetylmuramyl pentapeptide phosphotransferase/UDP-N-acetylglucosamine-1-phosphate transferase
MATNSSRCSHLTSIFARPFVLWGIAALATALTVKWIFKHQELHSPARSMLGFLPALLAILFVVAFVKDVRKLDEMRRRIHLQAAATSFLLTVILTFVFDGLKDAGIYRATLSDLDTATVLIWATALIVLSLRYR